MQNIPKVAAKIFKKIRDAVAFSKAQDAHAAFAEKAAKLSIYALIFLFPLFFASGVTNVLDFPKQFLLVGLVLIAAICYILCIFARGKIILRQKNILYLCIALFLIVYIFSALFSYSSYGSFWGWNLRVDESLLSFIALFVLFFLIHNLFKAREEILFLLSLLVASAVVAAALSFLQFFGRFILPFEFAKTATFNTVGTPSGLAVFLAVVLTLMVGLLHSFNTKGKILLSFGGVLVFAMLLIINAWMAWAVLLAGSAALLIIRLSAVEKEAPKLRISAAIIPVVLIAVSAFFWITHMQAPGLPRSVVEVYPDSGASFRINLQALKEHPLLGTGPGTFVFNYSRLKNPDMNQTPFWNVRFGAGASEVVDNFGTIGILGGTLFVMLLVYVLYLIYLRIKHLENGDDMEVGLVAGLIGGIAGFIFSASTASFDLAFWAILASFLAAEKTSVVDKAANKSHIFVLSPRWTMLLLAFVLVAVLLLGFGFLYLGVPKLIAEANYVKGVKALNSGNVFSAAESIERAVQFNPKQDNYLRDLSQIYLAMAQSEPRRTDIGPDQVRQNAGRFINLATRYAQQATDQESRNVANWSVRGFIYRNLIGSFDGIENAALNLGYFKALELEPLNPYLVTEIGRVYLQTGSLTSLRGAPDSVVENLKKSEDNFRKAIELKPDYAPARFQLAMVLQLKGNTSEAIKGLQETKRYVGNIKDLTGLSFQLGVLHYRAGNYALAKVEFEEAVSYSPDYSNARYFLGLIYDKEGQRSKALEQFERIKSLNPDNIEVRRILSNLNSGQPALYDIVQEEPPSAPALEDQPQEIAQ